MSLVKEKIELLPHLPGVYLMKGGRGEVLYIGKAKVLASRVRSYFHAGAEQTPKVQSMVSQIIDLEYMVTSSELEALILEGNLIKRYRPKYNVILRDDKNYPLLRLPIQEDYPRFSIVRQVKKDGALYFGPYVPTGGLYEMLRLLRKIFPIPNCTIEIDGSSPRPCIEFEIKRCLAPCTGNQSKEAYHKMMDQVRMFLEGKDQKLIQSLKKRMALCATSLNFEEAARLRDQIARIERALERQRVTSTRMEDQDVIAIARKDTAADIQVLFVRGGMVVGRRNFFFQQAPSDEALCAAFLTQFYNKEGVIPKEIVIPIPLSDQKLIALWLSGRRGGPTHLYAPSRGRRAQMLALAAENARVSLADHLQSQAGDVEKLERLKALLRLSRAPHRIEGYDISNIMGTSAVGSMVVFESGSPKKSDYRRFRIKTIEGANDFGMIAEVLSRRVAVMEEMPLPDLILIDGGAGQVAAARGVLERANIISVDLIGLAKEREDRGERVYLPGEAEPIPLPVGNSATHLLMRVRDEAHRFALSYHRKVRSKKMLASSLSEIEGIGKVRRLALLSHFGSLAKIRLATIAELSAAPSMNKKVVERLFEALHR